MPQIKNSAGETFDVSDVDAVRMQADDPSLQIVGDVRTTNAEGDAPVSRSADVVMRREGVAPASAGEQAAFAHKQSLKDKTSTLGSVVRGGWSGLTMGLGDATMDPEQIEADEAHHGIARDFGVIGGAFLPGLAGEEAGAAKLLQEPGAVEHATSSLSSKLLYGGELGAESGSAAARAERGLLSGGKAVDVATSQLGVAEDLAKLDAKGLRAAKANELDSIEAARVPQRAELADDLASFRQELKDQKVWLATKGSEDAEIRAIGKRTLKADRQLDNLLDNPKRLAEKPELAKAALQQQEAALETLASKEETLRKTFAADTSGERAAALDNAKAALEKNRALQARMAELVAEPRSARLSAIADAGDVLAQGGAKRSLAEEMLSGSIMGHVAGLVSGMPIIGPMIGAKAGKLASDLVFGRLGKTVEAGATRAKAAVSSFLDVAKRASPTLPVAATRVLSQVAFAPAARSTTRTTPTKGTKTDDLASLFKARSGEIKSQTAYDATGMPIMRPEARQAMASRFAGVRAFQPMLADKMETIAARRIEFLASKIPRRPDFGGLQTGPDRWQPSDMEMRKWARYVAAVEDPHAVVERLVDGSITPEDAEVMQSVYPELHAEITQQILTQLPALQKTLPYHRRLALSIFSGLPVDPAMDPRVLRILQRQFAKEEGTDGGSMAPRAQPQFGSVSKSLPEPTPAQARGR